MSEYDNSGILFKNHNKTKDTHPLYEGTAMVAGVKYKIASWVKDGKTPNKITGKIEKYMSISFKPVDEIDQRPTVKENEFGEPDDIPFATTIHRDVKRWRGRRTFNEKAF